MKRAIAILLLTTLCVSGGIQFQHSAVVAKKRGGAAGPSFIINEGFEGTGAPSGWSAGGAGTYDWDYTASPINGAQSLLLDSTPDAVGAGFLVGGILDEDEIWVKASLKFSALPGAYLHLFKLLDASENIMAYVQIAPSGALSIYDAVGGIIDAATVSTMSINTEYDVWFHYQKGTGANGVLSASFATTGSARPNSGNNFCSGSDGQFAANIEGWQNTMSAAVNTVLVLDDVQVAATDVF